MHYLRFPLFRDDLLGYQLLLLRRFSPLQVILFQMDVIRELCCSWGMFLDRGLELYAAPMTLDSKAKSAAV
jgi:hypothetical protein